eukprot:s2013_g5.t1
MGPQYDLFEVFCSDQSTLTSQVQQQGGKAKRFGLSQGDLQSAEGRKSLFAAVCRHRPKHVWVSPICKPWSSWSNLNCQKSLALWDKIHADRFDMLSQVALCLVLCRHQHRNGRHAHWEQPKGSHMFMLPYLNELFRYMLSAKPDMCTAGDLRDPMNHKHMKKGMHILTTSRKLFDMLDPLRCQGQHEHQPMEGSTHVHGLSIARTMFSERYPRKFARLISKVLLKRQFPREIPVGSIADPALTAFDQWCSISSAFAASERMAKKSKVPMPRILKASSADRSLDTESMPKRRRVKQPETSTKPEDPKHVEMMDQDKVSSIMNLVESKLPRVGKQVIQDPNVLQKIQELFHDKIVKGVLACKGTERTMAPPPNISSREAPYRRSIMKLRTSGKIILDDWERYDTLAKRKIIRKSHACRVNITVFAANPVEIHQPATDATANAPGSGLLPEAEGSSSTSEVPQATIDENLKTEKSDQMRTVPPSSISRSVKAPEDEASSPLTSNSQTARNNRFLALPQEEQSMLRRAHQNLCHPRPEQLSAVLKAQGVRPEIFQAVFDMPCSTCAAHQQPKIARPSTLKSELDFNDKVFIDGVTWTSKAGKTFHFYHMIDQATNFHVAMPAPCRAADQAAQCVSESWFQWAGPPNMMVTDAGTEFTSEHFQEFLQRHDVKPSTTAPHAHWQNGRCERHGHILQTMLNKIDHDMPVQTYVELQQALVQCTHAKNTLSLRKGYSPEMLVFGKSSRIPGSVASSELIAAHASADREDAHGIAFRKSLALREKARVAFHQADNDMALRRACLRRSRPDRNAYAPGEWIMMWQPGIAGKVKLAALNPEEQQAFAKAKEAEVQNWLKTGNESEANRDLQAREIRIWIN